MNKIKDALKEVWKTIVRWTALPVWSYQYSRGYGQSRKQAVRFAWDISCGCQGWFV